MKRNSEITDLLREKIRKIVLSLGYEFVGLEYGEESGRTVMRVYIDSLGGIIVKDCETVSRKTSSFLDENDLVPDERFFLEVSSPGLDRPLFSLDDYRRFRGEQVKIRLISSEQGRKKYRGTLSGVSDAIVHIQDDEGVIHDIPFEKIFKGNIVYQG